MNKLVQGLTTKNTRTENGMVTNSSTSNALLDFFFTAGAMRAADEARIIQKFSSAYGEDPITAMKLLFWARDIRQGAGERRLFRVIINSMKTGVQYDSLIKNLQFIPEFGRWDDLLDLFEKYKR